jgi:tetratricopeptide (TPR) repeat protein
LFFIKSKVLRKFTNSLLLVTAFLVVSGCVTQKKKGDVGPLGKGYHNMTAHYNGYYNATVLVEEGKTELESQYKDNYRKILPIYKYLANENPKAVADKMDKAAEKVSVVVNMHRVSRWTDDCYLVLGQSQFMKQDFESAEETLEFMAAEFDPKEVAKREAKSRNSKKHKKAVKKGKVSNSGNDGEEKVELSKKEKQKLADKKRKEREKERKRKVREAKKARKKGKKPAPKAPSEKSTEKKNDPKKEPTPKEEEAVAQETTPAPGSISLGDLQPGVVKSNPENYFMKHRPAYQEGMLWLARTYIERENYTTAERVLNDLESNPGTFDDVRRDAAIAKAHFFLKQKKYDQAVEPLNTAIDLVDDKPMKARLAFILGQIHQQAKRNEAAYAAYGIVLKNQPTYEMEFSARLNLATSSSSKTDAVSQLERMLKDEKNKEYQDQIYFALASIALENGNKPEGIKNLELSLSKSSANISQKAESYLLLGDLYFEEESYVKAKLYFDSTLMVMTDADERFRRVKNLSENLEGIASNLMIIEQQDSLLTISNMTEEEQLALATKIKKEKEEARIRKIKEEAEKGPKATNIPNAGPAPANAGNSKFFAYNDRNVKDGKRDFERKWGSRVLQDNWRRSDQSSIGDENTDIQAAKEVKAITPDEMKELLKDVPDTPEKLAAANRQIEAALFTLGTLYRDRLQNYKKSTESLEELLNRYPETQYKLDALYYLYLAYRDMGDTANTQKYYNLVVDNYPNSNYARILRDPSFAEEVKAKQDKLTTYYDETLKNFEQRDFQSAYDRVAKAPELFGGQNKLMSRFALLGAMCIGNLQGKEAYVEALKDVIAKYPTEPESVRAKEILRLLGENQGSGPGQKRDTPLAEGQVGEYKVTDDQLHYVIIVFNNEVVLNDAKIIVSDYNEKYHRPQKLRMNNLYLGEGEGKKPVIAIRRFNDKKEAMEYYDTAAKNRKDFLDESKYQYDVLPISQDNYRELLKSKTLDDYKAFFDLNYKK